MMKWTLTYELTDDQGNETLSNVTTFYNEGLDEVREQFEAFLRGCGYVIDYEKDENPELSRETNTNIDGWIWRKTNDNNRPLELSDDTKVAVLFRDSETEIGMAGNYFTEDDTDIVAYRILNEPEENAWIPWDGGKRPVSPHTLVDIKYRLGAEEYHIQACAHRWNHMDSDYDIIAYRVLK